MDPMMVSQGVLNLYELEEPQDEMLRVNNTKTLRRRFNTMITEPWMRVAMMAGDLGSLAAIGHFFLSSWLRRKSLVSAWLRFNGFRGGVYGQLVHTIRHIANIET